MNYSNPIVVLGNLKNEIIREYDMRIDPDAPHSHSFAAIETAIDEMLRFSGLDREELLCIAVSSPGVFDDQGNILMQNDSSGRILWSGNRLGDALHKKYGVDIFVKNDIKAATIGEWAFGAGKGAENILYISCGAGLGSGIVLNSKVYEGRRFNAGEIYYYSDGNDSVHSTGLESRICMAPLIRSCMADVQKGAETYLQNAPRPLGFGEVVSAYQNGDPYVHRRITWVCGELCTLMFNLGNFLALDEVIFGGEYSVFGDTLLKEYEKRFAPRLHAGARVKLAALGRYSGIHGLLFSARDAYFNALCKNEP